MTLVGEVHIQRWEAAIDRYEAELPPLKEFILPGGTQAAARLHLARTVCRRAERCVVALADAEPVRPEAIQYLNRLGDLLFVLARAAGAAEGGVEVPWRKESP
jgi:cob(I)alamin adenosyltransferase